jgi:predicted O-methyltransferase YrrM
MPSIKSFVKRRAQRVIGTLPPSVQGTMNRVSCTYSDIALWPFRDELTRDLTRIEWRKSEQNLRELQGFGEMVESAWRDLGSLGYELVRYYRPKVVVELGTHVGLSALAMGMALRDLDRGGKLYAVDTWEGDDHSGHYGDRLGLESVIVPMRMTFDEARGQVPDQIDLLHVDGLHTWDAVKHDFDTYKPLVRPGGIVLFHDVNTCYDDTRRFWKMVSGQYMSYMVPYSHGLGVIRV